MEPQGYKEKTVVLQHKGLRTLKGFVQIPRFILLHDELSYGAKVAYGVLLGYAWQDDFCFPAQRQLAIDLRCSDRWVRKFLDELKKAGYIDWKQQGLNRPNIYYVLDEKNPERNYTSTPERNSTAGQDRNHSSDYIYSKNNNHNNVNVDKEGKGGDEGEKGKTAFHASNPPVSKNQIPPPVKTVPNPAHEGGGEG